MEIYLDANATTAVLPRARAAALAVMSETFGNPSSIHGSGLRARALLDQARATARRVLNVPSGQVLFTSGATEGIQTAVLSALHALRQRRVDGEAIPTKLLYGATEHKAVPEALRHWNALLGLGLAIQAIPVDGGGRHDLEWLRAHAGEAGLVCTMAANNETGVISDLDGIAAALAHSPALWLVDGVQALGKLPLHLVERGIDYAPFSGHKLHAPKGIGMLYVREGAPLTPLLAGGGQEGALRSGTENMAGIAAMGAMLEALEAGDVFAAAPAVHAQRASLAEALRDAFPGIVFNAPFDASLPTTLNFSVPGLGARLLLDLFDAAGLRVSGGSACSAAKAEPSHVLRAMGLPQWQCESAIRLSFGLTDSPALIDEACARLRACADALKATCQGAGSQGGGEPLELLTRFVVDGACCYVLADASSRRCVVVDPLPDLTGRLVQWITCRGCVVVAVLDTHSHGDHASSAQALLDALPAHSRDVALAYDALGWPIDAPSIALGAHRISRLAIPGHTEDSTAYLLRDAQGALQATLVGDTVMPGALGRSDFVQSAPLAFAGSLRALEAAVGPHALLLPGHDYANLFATTLSVECAAHPLLAGVLQGRMDARTFAMEKSAIEQDLPSTEYGTIACGARLDRSGGASECVELPANAVLRTLQGEPAALLIDVREAFETRMGAGTAPDAQSVPLSTLLGSFPKWMALPADTPLYFLCRSGNRSAQAARALRRLGHVQAWSVAGGLALWPAPDGATPHEQALAP